MGFDKENIQTCMKLRRGEECLVQGFGQSMTPILKSGQVCRVSPVTEDTVLRKNDIVLCRVKGHIYLHKITAIKNNRYQISNNHKHVNGWIGKDNIYGKCVEIL